MPLPGGETDKIGNRYEGRWTVSCMIEVMDEKAESIRLEKPGEDAFEFFLCRNSNLEYHQVKRQKSGRGHWIWSALENKQIQILSDFWRSLSNPAIQCVFVSTQDAYQLRELSDRARGAISWAEFEREFLKSTQHSTDFNKLCQIWGNCPQPEAYESLKRIRVETVSEDFLLSAVESRLSALVEGEPRTIRLELAELALERIHHKLTTHDIWHWLEERGYRRRQWSKDRHVLAAVAAVNESYLLSLQEVTIAGHTVLRDEVQIICNRLTSSEGKRGIFLVGEAGVGKTGVTLQVVEQLRQLGLPLLAFRIDNLNPEAMPDNVGHQLGLPGSPSIVLATLAQGRNCVLVIDQLDAVSSASGRNPRFFICIEQIIKQAQAYPNMRLLLVCRKFDLDNDSRFKRLTGEKGVAEMLMIDRLSHDRVKQAVTELGLDAIKLAKRQLDLLSIPLHLNLLAEIAENATISTLDFWTAKDLLDRFWTHKELRVKERLGRPASWTQVIDLLCDRMSSEQIQGLSVSADTVDDYIDDARAMASEHVLAWEGKRIRFFHETFFDYAFARRFPRNQNLLEFLCGSGQHLFQRTQVRQILVYKREADFERYLNDLSSLLNSAKIRFHLKQVIFALLTSLPDPRKEEWEVIAPLIGEPADSLTQQTWKMLRSSVQWFELLDYLGIIEQWLYGNKEFTDQAVSILATVQSLAPERIVELIEPFIGVSDIWFSRLKGFINRSELANSRHLFELFLKLVRQGICDQQDGVVNYSEDFWLQINPLKDKKPDWACEAIACYFNHCLDLGVAANQPNIFDRKSRILPHSQFDRESILKCAQSAPKAFIQFILPFMLRLIELTVRQKSNSPTKDAVWSYKSLGLGYTVQDSLLSGMEVALSNLAINAPEEFSVIVERNLRRSNLETVQYLLIRAYAANGERFADEAADYLCEDIARLQTGYSSGAGNVHAAPYWATRQLLEAITPHCSNQHLSQLEEVILNYFPFWERKSSHRVLRGYAQFVLLSGIVTSRLSNPANRRLQEWKRKFISVQLLKPSEEIEPPKTIEARLVGSPIAQQASEKMTDQQWLKAISKYDYKDGLSRFARDGELVGGARQIAGLLEDQTKKEPIRFAKLAQEFSDNIYSCYFDAVLRGVSEVGADEETVLRLCQRCHQLPGHPCGDAICWLVQKLPHFSWTQEAFDIVIWYALNDPDPQQELWRTQTTSGQVYYGGSVLTAGVNTVRGGAATAIAKLLLADKNRARYFKETLTTMINDPSIAVRACVVEALTALLNYNRDLAVQLFLKLCETEDALLGTTTVEWFLYHAVQTHYDMLKSIIERMIDSELADVIEIGSRQACVASLSTEDAKSLAARCLVGTEHHQSGATEVFVNNFRSAHFREFCKTSLISLFYVTNEEIHGQAARCFLKLEGDELNQHIELANQFIHSPAFINSAHNLIHALEETTAHLPDLTYFVCASYVSNLLEQDAYGGRVFREADLISQLLVKVYSQSTRNSEMQLRCLDLIDRLAEMEVYGLSKALDQFER